MTLASRLVCDRVRSQVSLELDGELSHFERALVESHLRHCAGCRTFREDVASFTHEIRDAPLETWSWSVPLTTAPRRRRALADALRVASVAASIAVAVGLGVSVAHLGADSSRAGQAVRPAYLDSPQYDLSIIQQVRDAREAQRLSRAV
jgi:predicted anti-sigma-YlaC factor YlaD